MSRRPTRRITTLRGRSLTRRQRSRRTRRRVRRPATKRSRRGGGNSDQQRRLQKLLALRKQNKTLKIIQERYPNVDVTTVTSGNYYIDMMIQGSLKAGKTDNDFTTNQKIITLISNILDICQNSNINESTSKLTELAAQQTTTAEQVLLLTTTENMSRIRGQAGSIHRLTADTNSDSNKIKLKKKDDKQLSLQKEKLLNDINSCFTFTDTSPLVLLDVFTNHTFSIPNPTQYQFILFT